MSLNERFEIGKKAIEKNSVGFYHGNKNKTGNGLAKLYGLTNGIDMARFN